MTSKKGNGGGRRWTLASGASVLAAAAAAITATPAMAQDTEEEEEIVVTGTILRGNANSISPLEVLSAVDMEARGQTTVSETVQTLSGNNAGALPNSFSANGAFARGASGASLRGLLVSNTLVLVDGLRPAYYPLADDATRNFVDLNTIPQNVVERVEVLKDGASSTYGADAIAGVINVITRRTFTGAQLDISQGWSEEGGAEQEHFSGIWGHGDLSVDGYNFYFAAEYQQDDILYNRDRGFPFNTADLSSICGVSILDGTTTCDFNGVTNGIQFDDTFLGIAPNAAAVVRRANPGSPGTMFGDYQLLNSDCGDLTPVTVTPGQAQVPGFSNPVDLCQQDLVADYGVISPEDERFSVTGRMTFSLGDRAEFYAMGNYYQNDVFYTGLPANVRQRTIPAATGVTVSTANIALPVYVCPTGSLTYVCGAGDVGAVLNPNNPFAAEGNVARLFYRFGDIQNSTHIFSQNFRGAGGVTGDFDMQGHEYHYDVGLSAMQTDLEVTQSGRLYYPNLITAVNRGDYNFVNPSANSEDVRRFIAPDNVQNSDSKLIQVQANVSTDLFELPGGTAQGGLSVAARYESLDNPSANDDSRGAANRWLGINPFGASGRRDVESAAFEVDMPVLQTLDVNVSGRFDNYSTGQSDFSPKIGVRYTPLEFLSFRGTWSEGFRIPSFAESFAVPSTGFTIVNAGPACDAEHGGAGNTYCNGYSLGLTQTSSPNLDPETSTNFNIGVVVRFLDNWSFSADYYNIEKEDVIAGADYNRAIAAYYAGQPIPAGFEVIADAPDPNFPGGLPRIAFVRYGLENLNEQSTDGWDFNLSGGYDLPGGIEWTTRAEAAYIRSLTQSFPDGAEQEYAGTLGPYVITSASGTPQWRMNWQNTFTAGPASLTITAYYTDGYRSVAEDNAGDADDKSCLSGVAGGTPHSYLDGATPVVCEVDSQTYVDLHGSYDINERVQFYLDVSNVFGEDPAHDPTTYGGWQYNPAWGNPGIVGRYLTVGARLSF